MGLRFMVLSMTLIFLPSRKYFHELADRIVELVDHALLERDDGVIRDRNMLGTDPRAAFGDVAIADSMGLLELGHAVRRVQGMHLQRGGVDQDPRPDELLVLVVVAEHVADVLAEEALDALPELLHPVDVRLLHAPGAIFRVGRPRRELPDLLLDPVVPRHVRDEVAHVWEGPHRLDGDGLVGGELVQPRHAHQLRHPVHFRRA
jgi:hypothetical protein